MKKIKTIKKPYTSENKRLVRKIDFPNPNGEPRVETGAVQFGDDWPGYFIRGDDALALAMRINAIADHLERTVKDSFEVTFAVDSLKDLAKDIFTNTLGIEE